jgi:hypothetical protein
MIDAHLEQSLKRGHPDSMANAHRLAVEQVKRPYQPEADAQVGYIW